LGLNPAPPCPALPCRAAAASGGPLAGGSLLSSQHMAVLEGLPPALVPLVIAKSTARKGKGGRQPAADPRLEPGMDPKRAKRILANRCAQLGFGG
jgi:hypothetical protein